LIALVKLLLSLEECDLHPEPLDGLVLVVNKVIEPPLRLDLCRLTAISSLALRIVVAR
jgi:hypothetical protein